MPRLFWNPNLKKGKKEKKDLFAIMPLPRSSVGSAILLTKQDMVKVQLLQHWE